TASAVGASAVAGAGAAAGAAMTAALSAGGLLSAAGALLSGALPQAPSRPSSATIRTRRNCCMVRTPGKLPGRWSGLQALHVGGDRLDFFIGQSGGDAAHHLGIAISGALLAAIGDQLVARVGGMLAGDRRPTRGHV